MKLNPNFYYVLDYGRGILGQFKLLLFAKIFAGSLVHTEVFHDVDIYHGSKYVCSFKLK